MHVFPVFSGWLRTRSSTWWTPRTWPSSLVPPWCVRPTWTPSRRWTTCATRGRWWRCSSKTKRRSSDQTLLLPNPTFLCKRSEDDCLYLRLIRFVCFLKKILPHSVRFEPVPPLCPPDSGLGWSTSALCLPIFVGEFPDADKASVHGARPLLLCSRDPACVRTV